MIQSKGDKAYQTSIYIIVGILVLLALFPLIYVIGQSLLSYDEWTQSGGFVVFPSRPTLSAYVKILRYSDEVQNALKISTLRTLIGSAVQLLATLIFGYALSRHKLPGRKALLFMNLSAILFNGGLIPTFLIVKSTGLYNNFWAFILPGLVYTWGVLVFKQFFEGVPKSLEESAFVDGASEFRMMVNIFIPMSLPVVAAITLFLAVMHWNSWFDAMVFTSDDSLQPLQLLLRKMFVTMDSALTLNISSTQGASLYKQVPSNTMRMAIATIGMIPILCIYPFLQKYFIKGVYVGAVKE